MDENVVWLYKVLDVDNMTNEQLQAELDMWSNSITPHELIQQNDKLIIKYQSLLNRNAYLKTHLEKQISSFMSASN